MSVQARISNELNRLIDASSSRFSIALFLGLLVLVCGFAGVSVQGTVNQIENTQASFDERQLRNGYVAISDIQRLNLLVQEAVSAGGMTPELKSEFIAATDILYVRTDHFAGIISSGANLQSGQESIVQLNRILDLSDEAISRDFDNLPLLAAQLPGISQDARQALVTYLDDMRRMMDALLLKQTTAVQRQRTIVWATLGGLALIGGSAILLLRREVLARQQKRLAEERVHHLAYFDRLTGLPNRVRFQEELSEFLETNNNVALLLLDLDEFKVINDTYGQRAGDAVLCELANRLNDVAKRLKGVASRLDGDEFAIFFRAREVPTLKAICQSIVAVCDHGVPFEGLQIGISMSVGAATTIHIPSDMARSVDSLSRLCDFALSASKSHDAERYHIYDETLEQKFRERREIVEELPIALQNGDMEFFLQPKADIASERIYGFEALARWRRNGKIVPPALFIATAEEHGLIVEIDRYIARKACEMMAAYNAAHDTNFSISVNFSAVHFNSLTFIEFVKDALADSGLSPRLLTLEITETAELQDLSKVEAIIGGIHELGVNIAIDDFGAGFSSLSYLQSSLADEIKIDRSLVMDIEASEASRFLLSSIIGIAERLDFEVTVEGIETEAQLQICRAAGANAAQGYLLGRPEPLENAFAAAIAHNASLQGLRSAAG